MKDIYGMGHAMETGYRAADALQDGICNCSNCRRFSDETCPEPKKTRTEWTTCDYFKINYPKDNGGK